MLRASDPARPPIVLFKTGLGRLKSAGEGLAAAGAAASSGQAQGGASGGVALSRRGRRTCPVLRVHHPQLCIASLGARDWVLLDLKPAISYFFKLG